MISTVLPGLADKVIEKTLRVTRGPARAGGRDDRRRAPRAARDRGARPRARRGRWREGAELVIVFGASAIADRRDVIPAAVEAVGGTIEHFGMPVDPGNLMLVASRSAAARCSARRAARAAPRRTASTGCWCGSCAACRCGAATSPRMGVGGLLMEIVTRPQPRAVAEKPGQQRRRDRARGRALDPHGRAQQAPRRDRRHAAGAHRGGAGAGVAGAAGDRRHRASARAGRGGARRPRRRPSCTIPIMPRACRPR